MLIRLIRAELCPQTHIQQQSSRFFSSSESQRQILQSRDRATEPIYHPLHPITLHSPSRSVREWFAQTDNSAEESVKPTQHTLHQCCTAHLHLVVRLRQTTPPLEQLRPQPICRRVSPLQLTDWTAESSPAYTHTDSPSVKACTHSDQCVGGVYGICIQKCCDYRF